MMISMLTLLSIVGVTLAIGFVIGAVYESASLSLQVAYLRQSRDYWIEQYNHESLERAIVETPHG